MRYVPLGWIDFSPSPFYSFFSRFLLAFSRLFSLFWKASWIIFHWTIFHGSGTNPQWARVLEVSVGCRENATWAPASDISWRGVASATPWGDFATVLASDTPLGDCRRNGKWSLAYIMSGCKQCRRVSDFRLLKKKVITANRVLFISVSLC